MPSKENDRDDIEVIVEDGPPREKKRSSRTDRDKDREHRHHHKSSRSSRHRTTDSDVTHSSVHRRRRTKDKDKDRERDRDRDRDRDREKDRDRDSRVKGADDDLDSELTNSRISRLRGEDDLDSELTSDVVPELSRLSRTPRPYPSFSKAHSKESVVASREDLSQPAVGSAPGTPRKDPLTPEPTDVGSAEEKTKRSRSDDLSTERKSSSRSSSRRGDPPPSPPATSLSEPKEKERRSRTSTSSRSSRDNKEPPEERPRSRTSWLSSSTSRQEDKSKLSRKSRVSSQTTFMQSPLKNVTVETVQDDELRASPRPTGSTGSKRTASGETVRLDPVDSELSPESAQDSSPKTPTAGTPQFPPPPPFFHNEKRKPSHNLRIGETPDGPGQPGQPAMSTPGTDFTPSPNLPNLPPPPPPPPLHIQEVPKVNYLTHNGGLPKPVSKYFIDALPRQGNANRTSANAPPLVGAEVLFGPFFQLLDQYQAVLDSQGSIAVATGHKTIARRILDRLDNVFTRDLPEDGCSCIICERTGGPRHGLGWGEVLERYKSDNPVWPPFDLTALSAKAAEESAELPPRPDSPVKMDPDIAEEFRGHYLKQNKKVKAAVDKWLTSCGESPAPTPQEVDDETLAFAILTNLDQQDEQPYFNALLSGSREVQPALRAPTPLRKPRQDFLIRTGLSLQRYYGLSQAPRDVETAMYLVKNRHMHDVLRAVADINPSEWELLVSGRFDGFLWSGADNGEDVLTPTAETPSRGGTPAGNFPFPSPRMAMSPGVAGAGRSFSGQFPPSRGPTPFSRGATPASFTSSGSSIALGGGGGGRTAVTMDEELEVQTCAEVERFIYLGMEALEDAFETLHQRAEVTRTKLRQRNAGLQMALQRHRPAPPGTLTMSADPSPRFNNLAGIVDDGDYSVASESDWGADDFGELQPDDSASNISSSRHRRPKRRNERRTPAPIEEEDEGR